MLKPGTVAPDFTGQLDHGSFALSANRGHPVVVYFYPRDYTRG